MTRIPAAALVLSLAGLIPFLWGALLVSGMAAAPLPRFEGWPVLGVQDGRLLMLRYGVIILCFMSGVLWGFATRTTGLRAAMCYVLSVLPALWTFLFPGAGATSAMLNLVVGFTVVLMLDFAFWRWELAPPWWMSLRVPMTVIVTACLAVGAFA